MTESTKEELIDQANVHPATALFLRGVRITEKGQEIEAASVDAIVAELYATVVAGRPIEKPLQDMFAAAKHLSQNKNSPKVWDQVMGIVNELGKRLKERGEGDGRVQEAAAFLGKAAQQLPPKIDEATPKGTTKPWETFGKGRN